MKSSLQACIKLISFSFVWGISSSCLLGSDAAIESPALVGYVNDSLVATSRLVLGALVLGALILGALVLGALVLGALVLGALVLGALVLGPDVAWVPDLDVAWVPVYGNDHHRSPYRYQCPRRNWQQL